MEVDLRELTERTDEVVAAVLAGESVTLTSDGEPVADVVPRPRRPRWLASSCFAGRLADSALRHDLDRLLSETIDEL